MQRHNVPFMVSRISASVGCGFLSSIAFAVRICPFWQNPHCGTCSSIQACCSGCNFPFDASPSSVVTSPLTEEVGMMHDRTAAPLMITVQAPHWPRPHPNLGPCRPRSLRRTYSSGVAGSTSTVWEPPFTFNMILLIDPSLGDRHPGLDRIISRNGYRLQRSCATGRRAPRAPSAFSACSPIFALTLFVRDERRYYGRADEEYPSHRRRRH